MTAASLLVLVTACGGEFKPVLTDSGSTSGDAGSTSGDAGSTSGDAGSTSGDAGSTSGDAGSTSGDGGSSTGDGGALVPVEYCHLQWPCSLSGAPGESASVYVWVYQEGVTAGVGAGSGLQVAVGLGARGLDPADERWTWSAAAWYADKDGLIDGDLANDEYVGLLSLPSTAGDYDYAGRVSADEGRSWLYCDLAESEENRCGGAGSDDGYSSSTTGMLTVR